MRPAPYSPVNAEADRLYQKFCTMRALAYLGWFGLACATVSAVLK